MNIKLPTATATYSIKPLSNNWFCIELRQVRVDNCSQLPADQPDRPPDPQDEHDHPSPLRRK